MFECRCRHYCNTRLIAQLHVCPKPFSRQEWRILGSTWWLGCKSQVISLQGCRNQTSVCGHARGTFCADHTQRVHCPQIPNTIASLRATHACFSAFSKTQLAADNTELVHQTNGAYIDFNLIASDGTFMKSARQIEDGNTLGFSMSELLTAAGLPKDSLLATANLQGIVGMNASRSPPYRVTGILLAVDFWCSNIRPNTFEWSSQDK